MKSKSAEDFLRTIRYEERLKQGQWFTNQELRNIMGDKLDEYVLGNLEDKFVVDLAWALYQEAIAQRDADPDLEVVLCNLANAHVTEVKSLVNKSRILLSRHDDHGFYEGVRKPDKSVI